MFAQPDCPITNWQSWQAFSMRGDQGLRPLCLQPHAPPDDAHMKQLEDEILKQPAVERPARPWWVGSICAHRERFRGVGFTTSTQSDSVVWLMLFAMQNPQQCTFLRLSPLPTVLGDIDDVDDGTAFEYREFDFFLLQFAEEHELGPTQMQICCASSTSSSAVRLQPARGTSSLLTGWP